MVNKDTKLTDKEDLALTILLPEVIEEEALMSAILLPEEGEEHGFKAENTDMLQK